MDCCYEKTIADTQRIAEACDFADALRRDDDLKKETKFQSATSPTNSDFRYRRRADRCSGHVLAFGAGNGAVSERQARDLCRIARVEKQAGVQRRLADDRGLGYGAGATDNLRSSACSV